MTIKIDNTRLRRTALASAMTFALAAPGLTLAQATPTTPATATGDEPTVVETVQVVGSRIKRATVEGPSPVTIISAQDIERSGFNTVHDALEVMAQNIGFGQNDFNAAGGFTPNGGVVNLRGMGPGRTLLLINGRRANDYPFPYNGRSNFQNFNNIPSAAVERIEILAGGASAIYGSDAVAGVINVVLKKNYEGDVFSVRGTGSEQGGANTMDLSWVGGKTWDNGSITYALEYFDRSALFAWQRDFMDSGADNPSPPGVNGSTGVGGYQPSIGSQIRRLNTAGTVMSYFIPAGYDCSGSEFYRPHTYTAAVATSLIPAGGTIGPGCGYDRFLAEQTVINGTEDVSAYIIGNIDFTDTLSGWASIMAYQSDAELGGGVEQWQGGPQPGASFYDPRFPGARTFPIRALSTESYGGPQGTFQKFQEKSYEFAAGLSGTLGDRFDWDLTASTSKYEADRQRPRLTVDGATAFFMGPRLGTVGQGAYAGVVGAPAGMAVYQLNLDHFYGPITYADYASMSTQVEYEAESENQLLQAVVSGDLFELPGGTAAFAAVAEYGSQSYELNSDPRIAPDVRAIYNLTGTGGGGDRDRMAFGIEGNFPLFEMLTVTTAARYDKYDDITEVDDAVTWNGGLEFRPFESLLIRGSYATSFKAPDMHYVFAEQSGSFSLITDYTSCANAAPPIPVGSCSVAGANYRYSPFAISQGNPNLEEETGTSWSAGLVWDITDQFSFTADYYEIVLENEVSVIASTTIVEDEYGCVHGTHPVTGKPFPYALGSAYCDEIFARITRDPTDSNRISEILTGPVNLSKREVHGIDASLRYGWDTDRYGDFSARVVWSHILTHDLKLREDSAIVGRDSNGSSDFRSRATVELMWVNGDWDSKVHVIRTGSFPRWNLLNTNVVNGEIDHRAPPHTVVNWTIGRRWTENFSMRFNVNNVFDDVAPHDPTFNAYPYFWSAFSPVGREYGLQMDYQF